MELSSGTCAGVVTLIFTVATVYLTFDEILCPFVPFFPPPQLYYSILSSFKRMCWHFNPLTPFFRTTRLHGCCQTRVMLTWLKAPSFTETQTTIKTTTLFVESMQINNSFYSFSIRSIGPNCFQLA